MANDQPGVEPATEPGIELGHGDNLPDNVIALPRTAGDARFPHIAMVEAYWLALRGRRLVPRRTDLDPRGIEASLEQAFIAEMIAPGVARLRIAGSHLTRLMGMEVRGMPLSALFAPSAREDMANILRDLCALPQMTQLSLQAETGIGKPPLEARMLLLPLRGDTDAIDRVLGCLASESKTGLAPRRFTITSRRLTPLTPPPEEAWRLYRQGSLSASMPNGSKGQAPRQPHRFATEHAAQAPDRMTGLHEGPAPFSPAAASPTPFAQAPHLRVIQTPPED